MGNHRRNTNTTCDIALNSWTVNTHRGAPVRSAARYIGRVGALAVALGIGTAASAIPGVAYAEPDAGNPSSASSESSPSKTGGDGNPDTAGTPTAAAAAGAESQDNPQSSTGNDDAADATDSADANATDADATDDANTDDSAAGSADTTGGSQSRQQTLDTPEPVGNLNSHPATAADPGVGNEVPTQTSGGGDVAGTARPVDTPAPARNGHRRTSLAEADTRAEVNDSPARHLAAAAQHDDPVQNLADSQTASSGTGTVNQAPVAATPAVPQALSAPAQPEAPATPSTASSTLTAVVSSLLGTGGVDNGPVESPASWMMLAAARRELGNTEPSTFSVATPTGTGQLLDSQRAAPAAATPAVPNTAPRAWLDYLTTPNRFTSRVYGDIDATDPDRDRLTYRVAEPPAKGWLTVNRFGGFVFTPTMTARHAAAAVGATTTDKQDTFIIAVSDGKGGTATVDVTVAIKPANTKPIARNTVTAPNPITGEVTVTVTATDRDGDPLTYTAPTTTDKGTVANNGDGTFTYTPTPAARQAATNIWKRSDSFKITVNDGHGGTTSTTARVSIAPPANPAAISAPGTALGSPIVGDNGYGYQVVIQPDPEQQNSIVLIKAPDGTGSVSQALPGLVSSETGDPTALPEAIPRADGSIVFLTTQTDPMTFESVRRLVSVTPDGTTTVEHTTAQPGWAVWAGDGTVYSVESITKTVTVDGVEQDQYSFQVARLDTAGELTWHTYDGGPDQYPGFPVPPVVGSNGTLYVPFANFSDPIDGILQGHPAVFAIPTSGSSTVIPFTTLTGTDPADIGFPTSAGVSADGTVYAAGYYPGFGRVLAIAPGGSTATYDLPGDFNGMQVGGPYAVVGTSTTDEFFNTVYSLTFIDAQGVVGTQPWSGGQFVVGPDGTAYTTGETGTSLITITPTSVQDHALGGSVDSASESLQFASDGTAFALVRNYDDGVAHISIVSTGALSPSVPMSTGQTSFRVINDVALLIAADDGGMVQQILAIDAGGNIVADHSFTAADGLVPSPYITVGVDGVIYAPVLTGFDPAGGDYDGITTVWGLEGTTAQALFSRPGIPGGLTASADGKLYMPLMQFGAVVDGTPQNPTTTLVTIETPTTGGTAT